jgi:hypothetical protein
MKKRKNAIDTLSIMTPTCIYISYQSFSFFSFLIFQMPGRIESQTTQMKNETCSLLHYTVQLYTCANYQRRKASIFKQCLSFFLPYLLRRPHQLKRVYQHFWKPFFFLVHVRVTWEENIQLVMNRDLNDKSVYRPIQPSDGVTIF